MISIDLLHNLRWDEMPRINKHPYYEEALHQQKQRKINKKLIFLEKM